MSNQHLPTPEEMANPTVEGGWSRAEIALITENKRLTAELTATKAQIEGLRVEIIEDLMRLCRINAQVDGQEVITIEDLRKLGDRG